MEVKGINVGMHPLMILMGAVGIGLGGSGLYASFVKEFDGPLINAIIFWIGLFGFMFGFSAAFYVEKFFFDINRRILLIKRGFLLPFLTTKYSFSEIISIEGRRYLRTYRDGKNRAIGSSSVYQGYLITSGKAIKFGWNGNEKEFRKNLAQTQTVLNVPMHIEIDEVGSSLPVEESTSINRILLLLGAIFAISWLLVTYVWAS